MTRIHGTFALTVVILIGIPMVQLFATLPGMVATIQQVTPQEARPGEVVLGTGYALDASHVQELYLVDNEQISYRAEILEQMSGAIRFRVPLKTPAGQMRIAVKIPGHSTPIEQMAFLDVL
jgi:hypothetical protein